MRGAYLIARTAISTATFSFDKIYSYIVPPEFMSDVKVGMRVLVPFGKGNRKTVALITELIYAEHYDSSFKQIVNVIDKQPLINEEMLGMMFWLKEYTFCTYFDAYKTMVPNGFSYKVNTHYSLANVNYDDFILSDDEQAFLSKMSSAKNQHETDALFFPAQTALPEDKKHLKELTLRLLDKGLIEEIDFFKRAVGDETEQTVRLTEKYILGELHEQLSVKQTAVVQLLEEISSASVKEVCYMTGCTKAVVKRLAEKQVVKLCKVEIMRKATADADERKSPDEIFLSDEQSAAYDGIMQLVKAEKPSGALLYGVTGSGKTSVFFKLIDSVLKMGKTVLMMVPEISLTPQMVKKFKLYFGDDIALLHSSLSLGQRTDEFKRIRSGEAKIVIGTRSAVFAPLENLGLIIMDEEGERTYKSDSSPRYHARDVAMQRCGYHSCVLLLASATPSIESFYFAKIGRFHLFKMKKRYANAVLPSVEIVDMQTEQKSDSQLFSKKLADAIGENLKRGEQTILLLNRRGFTTYVSCSDCRQPISCPNCSLPLTYHKKNDRLMCHYCGYAMNNPSSCPSCGGERLKQSGAGTQKIEDELQRLFPDARLLRMDADTTFSRFAYEENFSAFEQGKYDIMLGTQMIAKGLNFPNVTLVGIVSIDKALFTGDFRSYERTFSLITQVAGRSGRGDKPGRAYIQTFVPDHYVINLAAQQDYDEFYEQEAALRKALLYPPFCDICAVNLSSAMESRAIEAADEFLRIMREYALNNRINIPLRVLGPAPCTLGRINNKYRYRIIIKCRISKKLHEMISDCMTEFYKLRKFSEVRLTADINGDIGL